MSNSLYITSLEEQSGKVLVALGFMEQLSGRVERLSVFRPVVSENGESDTIITLMRNLYNLPFSPEEMYGVSMADAGSLLALGKSRRTLHKNS